jgi:hypothetical protein
MPTGPTAPVRSWIDVTVIVLGSLEVLEPPELLELAELPAALVLLLDELQAAATIVTDARIAVADAARLYRDDLIGLIESCVT